MISEIGEYKGSPTITLKAKEDDKYPFTFGVGKAKLIVEHIDDIRDFLEQHGSPKNDKK